MISRIKREVRTPKFKMRVVESKKGRGSYKRKSKTNQIIVSV